MVLCQTIGKSCGAFRSLAALTMVMTLSRSAHADPPAPPPDDNIAHNVYCEKTFGTGGGTGLVINRTVGDTGTIQCTPTVPGAKTIQMFEGEHVVQIMTLNWSNQDVHYLELTLNSGATYVDFVGGGAVDLRKPGIFPPGNHVLTSKRKVTAKLVDATTDKYGSRSQRILFHFDPPIKPVDLIAGPTKYPACANDSVDPIAGFCLAADQTRNIDVGIKKGMCVGMLPWVQPSASRGIVGDPDATCENAKASVLDDGPNVGYGFIKLRFNAPLDVLNQYGYLRASYTWKFLDKDRQHMGVPGQVNNGTNPYTFGNVIYTVYNPLQDMNVLQPRPIPPNDTAFVTGFQGTGLVQSSRSLDTVTLCVLNKYKDVSPELVKEIENWCNEMVSLGSATPNMTRRSASEISFVPNDPGQKNDIRYVHTWRVPPGTQRTLNTLLTYGSYQSKTPAPAVAVAPFPGSNFPIFPGTDAGGNSVDLSNAFVQGPGALMQDCDLCGGGPCPPDPPPPSPTPSPTYNPSYDPTPSPSPSPSEDVVIFTTPSPISAPTQEPPG